MDSTWSERRAVRVKRFLMSSVTFVTGHMSATRVQYQLVYSAVVNNMEPCFVYRLPWSIMIRSQWRSKGGGMGPF